MKDLSICQNNHDYDFVIIEQPSVPVGDKVVTVVLNPMYRTLVSLFLKQMLGQIIHTSHFYPARFGIWDVVQHSLTLQPRDIKLKTMFQVIISCDSVFLFSLFGVLFVKVSSKSKTQKPCSVICSMDTDNLFDLPL